MSGVWSGNGLGTNLIGVIFMEYNSTLTIKSTPHGRAVSSNYLN